MYNYIIKRNFINGILFYTAMFKMEQIKVSMLMKTVAFASNLLFAGSRQPIIKLMIAAFFWLELMLSKLTIRRTITWEEKL